MTEIPVDEAPAPPPPPPPAPPPTPPPLVRPQNGRVFRGVCLAAARATGTDPVLWRVLVVVLALFGGTGLVLYLAGWLLIPEEGAPESDAQRLVRGQSVSSGAVLALVALAVLAVFVVLDGGRGLVPLVVVGVLAWLVLRSRASTSGAGWPSTAAPPAGPGPGAPVAGWGGPPSWTDPSPAGAGAPAWGPPPGAYPPTPPPPKPPRSPLAALTLSAVALVVGGLLLAGALGLPGVTAERVLAAALLVTGAGLFVGARWGRARGLIALAVVLGLALGAVSGVDQRLDTSAGERTWVVDGPARHSLGAGSAVLDLRPLAGTQSRNIDVEASIGVGELVVLVPDDLRVELNANVGLGELDVEDGTQRSEGGPALSREAALGPVGPRNVRLDVRVGLGELEVRRGAG